MLRADEFQERVGDLGAVEDRGVIPQHGDGRALGGVMPHFTRKAREHAAGAVNVAFDDVAPRYPEPVARSP